MLCVHQCISNQRNEVLLHEDEIFSFSARVCRNVLLIESCIRCGYQRAKKMIFENYVISLSFAEDKSMKNLCR